MTTERGGGQAGPRGSRRPARGAPRLVVSGATGRLGSAFLEVAAERGWPIHGGVAGARSLAAARTARASDETGAPTPLCPADEIDALLVGADLYVGAAPADAERTLLPRVAARGIPAVVAATGFDASDEEWFARVREKIPIVWEPNFSTGIAWMHALVSRPGGIPPGFDLSIVEAHRRGKRDRPSGTADALARGVAPGTDRPGNGIPEIASVRVGELPGIHELWMGGRYELLRVEHVVLDRRAFAEGMARAVEWLWSRPAPPRPGRYRFSEVVGPQGPGGPG